MFTKLAFQAGLALALVVPLPGQDLDAVGKGSYLDPASATWLSAAFTVLPVAAGLAMTAGGSETAGPLLLTTGLTLGPAIGYFSTGRTGRGFAGLGIRTGVFLGSATLAVAICPIWCSESESHTAELVFVGGMVVTAGLAVYDIAKVRRKRVTPGGANSVRVYPTWVPAVRAPGLGVQVAF